MKNISKYNYLFIGVGCFILIGLMSLTYSKFSYEKELSGSINTIKAGMTLYETLLDMDYTLDTDFNFRNGTSGEDIGLIMREGTQNDEYPILYFRGPFTANVIFADLCWFVVRTTETGGVKLVFNGPVVDNVDGTKSCTDYGGLLGEVLTSSYTDIYIGNTATAFNLETGSPVYGGYMYNDTNNYVKYIFKLGYTLDVDGYKSHLADNSIDGETGRHTQNKTDSTIKGVIDDWYEENILGKPEESLLEDTVWCNDRSVISETYSIENYSNNHNTFYFATYTRLSENYNTPSLVCNRDMDKFTVDSINGNGDLDYPIGLLTADEMVMAGSAVDGNSYGIPSYLDMYLMEMTIEFIHSWSLSPTMLGTAASYIYIYSAILSGLFDGNATDTAIAGARPSISLNNSATVSDGVGSFETPFIIEP